MVTESIPPPRPRRVIAFVNPATRSNAATCIAAVQAAAPSDVNLEIRETTPYPLSPSLLDPVNPPDIVIAIGGDGTVSAVATLLAALPPTPLAIIPAGSTNVIAKGLGIPRDPAQAAALCFGTHRLRTLDVGVCGEHRFLHMAGIGFDAHLFAGAHRGLKRRIGWLAYLPAAVAALRVPPTRLSITANGNTLDVRSSFVLFANGDFVIHPVMRIGPGIRPDDGQLDVYVVTATSPIDYVRTVARFLGRSLVRSPYVIHLRTTHLTVNAESDMPLECDGDVTGTTPVEVRLIPGSQPVVVPLLRS